MARYKFIIGILFVLCLQPLHALAQGSEPPIPPAPTGGNIVLDTLDWLTEAQESEINSINKKLDEAGIAQIAVVTLDDCGDDKQKFRNDLFRTWGIGHANDNDGLLIMVCWYGGDQSRRSVEQETGFGLEGTLPDMLTARVVDDEFIPAFQSNQPGNGLVAMVKRYDGILRHEGQLSASSARSIDMKLAYIIIAALGIIPGLVFFFTYKSIITIIRGVTPQSNNENNQAISNVEIAGFMSPWIYQIALFEAISLVPILATLYISLKMLNSLPQLFREYGIFILPYLFIWLIILVVFYLSKFFKSQSNDNDWHPVDDSLRPFNDAQSTDFLDNLSDLTRDLPSFGDGDSGGGGSSKKF